MTSGAHSIDWTANPKAQVNGEGPGLSFGYFEILLGCIVIEIIGSFWENSPILGKFDLCWPPVTSILTSSKNDPYVFCRTWHGLSNAVYRFSMRCVVLEISRGGWNQPPPPAGSRLAQTPAGARVNRFATCWSVICCNCSVSSPLIASKRPQDNNCSIAPSSGQVYDVTDLILTRGKLKQMSEIDS